MAAAARSWDRAAEGVLALAGHAVGAVVALGAEAHGALVEGAEQPVVHHRVDQRAVPDPVAGPGPGQQVGGLGHRLHAAGHHDVGLAGVDHQVGQVDGVEAGQADLVDRGGRHGHRDAGLDGRLAGGDLAGAGLDDLAHEHVVDLVGRRRRPAPGRRRWRTRRARWRRSRRGHPTSLPIGVRAPATMTVPGMTTSAACWPDSGGDPPMGPPRRPRP